MVARDPGRAAELDRQLFDVSEAVRMAAVLLAPVMPRSSAEVLERIGAPAADGGLRLDRDAVWHAPPGAERRLVKAPPLWPRLEPGKAAGGGGAPPQVKAAPSARKEQAEMDAAEQRPAEPQSPRISIDEFARVELRVGRVVAADAVPNRASCCVSTWRTAPGCGRSSPASSSRIRRRRWSAAG